MSHVVIVVTRPAAALVAHSITRLRDHGHEVTLVAPRVVGAEVIQAADRHIEVSRPFGRGPAPAGLVKGRPRWVVHVAKGVVDKGTSAIGNRTVGPGTLWWHGIRRSNAAREALGSADVMTAADANAVYTVWRAARDNVGADAVNGIGPTMDLVVDDVRA
ncbi:hypothetical protein BCF74_12142 [Knoellia remsis]|uniref:Uncharacterized protein n=1 Tax=Knoellia remsis TaxID=407159 RepID=A0A2T0UD46_9MICO|nr:hypothetical protein [Knoellia remsis]PRY55865.1 hypothetical protein BCF74_12142 [Knoellia remsis]